MHHLHNRPTGSPALGTDVAARPRLDRSLGGALGDETGLLNLCLTCWLGFAGAVRIWELTSLGESLLVVDDGDVLLGQVLDSLVLDLPQLLSDLRDES